MEGAALRAGRAYDLAIAQAWHAANFNAAAKVGKLRRLSSYIGKKATTAKSTLAQAIGFFHSMKAAGFPVKIERVERKSDAG